MGDFNVDCRYTDSDNQFQGCLRRYMNMFDFSQFRCHPTRITSTTATVLDLILVSDPIKISNSDLSDFGVSNHLMSRFTRKCKITPINEHNGVKIRSLKNTLRSLLKKNSLM